MTDDTKANVDDLEEVEEIIINGNCSDEDLGKVETIKTPDNKPPQINAAIPPLINQSPNQMILNNRPLPENISPQKAPVVKAEEKNKPKDEIISEVPKTPDASIVDFILPLENADKLNDVIECVKELKKQTGIIFKTIIPCSNSIGKTVLPKLKSAFKGDKTVSAFKSKLMYLNDLRNDGVKKSTNKYIWVINDTFRFDAESLFSQLNAILVKAAYDCLAMSYSQKSEKQLLKFFAKSLKSMDDTKGVPYDVNCKIIKRECFCDFFSRNYKTSDLAWWLKQLDNFSSFAVCEKYIFTITESIESATARNFLQNNCLTLDQCVLTEILKILNIDWNTIEIFFKDAIDVMSLRGTFKNTFAYNVWFEKVRIVMANIETGKFSF